MVGPMFHVKHRPLPARADRGRAEPGMQSLLTCVARTTGGPVRALTGGLRSMGFNPEDRGRAVR